MRFCFLLSMSSLSLVVSACVPAEIIELGGDAGHSDNDAPASVGTVEVDDGGFGFDGPFGDATAGSTTSIVLPATGGPASAADGWILFDSDRVDLVQHIFAVRADGTGLTPMTSGTSPDTEPAVSPDGKTIAFTSARAGTPQVFALDVASQAVKQLSTISGGAGQATFSPDGKTIAFHSGYDVYVMNADGSSARVVIVSTDSSFGTNYEHPVFGPNGDQIIVDRNNEVDAFDLSGQMLRYVVGNTTFDELEPALSRDGANIAFVTDSCNYAIANGIYPATDSTIELASASGTLPDRCNGRQATATDLGSLSHPSWGPGTLITFAHVSSSGLTRIVVSDAANLSAQGVELVQDNGNQRNPTWAPSTFSPP